MSKDNQKEKTVVITGATKGLGRSLSLSFARAGYKVIGIYRSDSASAGAIKAEFGSKGFSGVFVRQDITIEGDWAEFDEIVKSVEGDRLTLIANASTQFAPKPFHLIDWPEVSRQLEVNVKGTFLVLGRLLPIMAKARDGSVITVLSSALGPPAKGFAAYVTAKSALDGLTRAVSAEFSQRGLRVFSVSPGFMETSLTNAWNEHFRSLYQAADPDTRTPDEYAEKILSLAEDMNTDGEGENYLLTGVSGPAVHP